MAVGEIPNVTALVPGGRETGERPAVVHRHQKPAVVNAQFMLVHHHPDLRRADRSEFIFPNEGPVPILSGIGFHVAAAHPAVHGIAPDMRLAAGL